MAQRGDNTGATLGWHGGKSCSINISVNGHSVMEAEDQQWFRGGAYPSYLCVRVGCTPDRLLAHRTANILAVALTFILLLKHSQSKTRTSSLLLSL